MENQFVLLLFQTGDFKGAVVCTPNPSPNPGIWYYEQGAAKPPLPLSVVNGTFNQVLGPCLLAYSGGGDLLATLWDLDYATAKSGATGSASTPALNFDWQFEPLQGGTGAFFRHAPDLATKLGAT